MACNYKLPNSDEWISEKEFKKYLKENLENLSKEGFIKPSYLKIKENAISKQEPAFLHGSTQEGTPKEGGEFEGVGTSKQRVETPQESPEKEGVGVRNADTYAERQRLGLPQIEKEARQSNQQVWDKVKEKGEIAIRDIVRSIAETKGAPNVTVENQAAILLDRVRIAKEYNNIQEELSKAFENKDKEATSDLLVRQAQLETDRDINDYANTRLGSEWGGVGNFRQGVSDLEFTYENVVREFKNANLGEMSAEERKFFKDKITELEALNKQLDDYKKKEGERYESLRQEHYKEFIQQQRKNLEGRKYTVKAKEVADKFRTTLKSKKDWVDADGNPLQVFKSGMVEWNDIVEIGAKAIEKTGEVLDGIREVINYLSNQKWFAELSDRDKKAVEQQIKDEFEKAFNKVPDSFDKLIDTLVERAKGKIDVNNHTKLDGILQRLLKVAVQEGAKDMPEVVNRIQEAIKGRLDVSNDDLGDAISGYGTYRKLSPEQIDVQIRKIKSFARQDAAIRDVEQKKLLPKRTGFERDKLDVDQRAKRKKLLAAIKESGLEPQLTDEELAKQYKSDLDAYHTRLTNAIEDIQKELDTNQKRAKAQGKVYSDEDSVRLQERLKVLRKRRDERFPKEPMSDEKKADIIVKGLEESINDLNAEIKILEEGGTLGKKDKPASITNDKINSLRELKKELEIRKDFLTPESVKESAAYEKWINSRERLLEKLKTKLETGDFAPKFKYEFAKNPLSDEGSKLQYEITKTSNAIKRKIEQAKVRNRGGTERWLDAIPALKKTTIFLGVSIYPKLASAAALLNLTNAIRKPIQYGLSKLPIIKEIAAKAPVEGYVGKGSGAKLSENLAESFTRLWHKETIEEAKKAFRNEQRYIDRFEKHYKHVDKNAAETAARFLINTHKAIKNFPEQAEYWAAVKNATKWAIDNGMNPNDLMVQDLIHTLAKDAASNTILMNKTMAGNTWKGLLGQIKNWGDDKSMAGRISRKLGKGLASALETEIPVVGVPINTVNEALSYLGGGFKAGLLRVKGLDAMTNADADKAMKLLGKNVIGWLTLSIAWYFHKNFGGLYHKGKRDEDNLKEGEIGTKDFSVPALLLHHPVVYADMIVADMLNEMDKNPDKGWVNTIMGSMNAVANTVPYLSEISKLQGAFSGERKLQKFGSDFLGGFLPQVLKETAKYMDRDSEGNPINRYPQNFEQDFAMNFPIARQTYVPTSTEVEQEKRAKELIPKTVVELKKMDIKQLQSRISSLEKEIESLKTYTGNGKNKDKVYIAADGYKLDSKAKKEQELISTNEDLAATKKELEDRKKE